MRKYFIVLLAILCVLMAACGKEESATITYTEAAVFEAEVAQTSEATEASRIAESYPVVALDNEYVKITIEGKFSESDKFFMDFGYNILIENKCDRHITVVPTNCSADGFMLPLSETPHIETSRISPNTKAKTFMFYMNTEGNTTVKSVDDLVNFDGQWQLHFSDDGLTWNDFANYSFEYILP